VHHGPVPEHPPARDRAAEDGSRSPGRISSDELYGEIWAERPSALKTELGRSLEPRGTTMLYDEFARLGVGTDSVVLDAGARDAAHAVELVRRLGCRVIAVDPVALHGRARERVAAAELQGRVDVVQAGIESVPLADASVDFVWCRDVRLDPGPRELARVLRPGGIIYQLLGKTWPTIYVLRRRG
jgi:SAM-dependent methyltransferase